MYRLQKEKRTPDAFHGITIEETCIDAIRLGL